LKEAEKKKVKSISIPGISTGVLGFPKELCAEILFEAAIEHYEKYKGEEASVNEIRFVNFDDNTVSFFKKEFKNKFGGESDKESESESESSSSEEETAVDANKNLDSGKTENKNKKKNQHMLPVDNNNASMKSGRLSIRVDKNVGAPHLKAEIMNMPYNES